MAEENSFLDSSFYTSDTLSTVDHARNFRNSLILEELSQRDLTAAFNDEKDTIQTQTNLKLAHTNKDGENNSPSQTTLREPNTTKTIQISSSPSLSALSNLLNEKSKIADQKMRNSMLLDTSIIEEDEDVEDGYSKEFLNLPAYEEVQVDNFGSNIYRNSSKNNSTSPNLLDIDGLHKIQVPIPSSNFPIASLEQPDFLTTPRVEPPKAAVIARIHSPSKLFSNNLLSNNNNNQPSFESELYLNPLSRSHSPVAVPITTAPIGNATAISSYSSSPNRYLDLKLSSKSSSATPSQCDNSNIYNNQGSSNINYSSEERSTSTDSNQQLNRHLNSPIPTPATTPLKVSDSKKTPNKNRTRNGSISTTSTLNTTPSSSRKKKGLFSFLKKKPSQNDIPTVSHNQKQQYNSNHSLPTSSTFSVSQTSLNSNTSTPEKLQKKSHSSNSIFSSFRRNRESSNDSSQAKRIYHSNHQNQQQSHNNAKKNNAKKNNDETIASNNTSAANSIISSTHITRSRTASNANVNTIPKISSAKTNSTSNSPYVNNVIPLSSSSSSSPIKRDGTSNRRNITPLAFDLAMKKNQSFDEDNDTDNQISFKTTSSDVEVNTVPITYHPNIPELIIEGSTTNNKKAKSYDQLINSPSDQHNIIATKNTNRSTSQSKGLFERPLGQQNAQSFKNVSITDDDFFQKPQNPFQPRADYGESLFPKTLDEQEVESIISLERTRSIKSNNRNSIASYRKSSDNYSLKNQNEGMIVTEPTSIVLSTPDLTKSPASSILKSGKFENADTSSNFSGMNESTGSLFTGEAQFSQPSQRNNISNLQDISTNVESNFSFTSSDEQVQGLNLHSEPLGLEADTELMSDIMEFADLIDFGDSMNFGDTVDFAESLNFTLDPVDNSKINIVLEEPVTREPHSSKNNSTMNEAQHIKKSQTIDSNYWDKSSKMDSNKQESSNDANASKVSISTTSYKDISDTEQPPPNYFYEYPDSNNINSTEEVNHNPFSYDPIQEPFQTFPSQSSDNAKTQLKPNIISDVENDTENNDVESLQQNNAYFPETQISRPISMSFKGLRAPTYNTSNTPSMINSVHADKQDQKINPTSDSKMKAINEKHKVKVDFSQNVILFETYSQFEYDRKPEVATCNLLTPQLAQLIKSELNELKSEMEVHIDSRCYTHFY
ncbi:hypothetical protein TBLA_0G00150 [Henningerozyma blattae CBS 6284]|uniref:Protein BNI4 n=1 Tax=Henningerozyma blattae (strain ATCC 34711 / CBS 6284 / DSM 70876 / NBRC 10599 / NRRL Y-10934 / UCD 77-7) TaxID=1071380 RepID=I2H6G4_HENB6|nr:hypothetical protein TBLA_0G00150 [Tetrapisispora blattae CBS 6284]CCH61966.1 hypothetical protein TBLA_0G00150 [Tetrapisispora blattae CBS 6284]